jgi:hypothetical protein
VSFRVDSPLPRPPKFDVIASRGQVHDAKLNGEVTARAEVVELPAVGLVGGRARLLEVERVDSLTGLECCGTVANVV